ncbi:hypothetical protein AURDEDRAFT_161003 [Auricularia subglabra TFB-10046 SS5]|nr:hypothetical protein AURDEDRAFT_161003 [Auricularia subglabra TFB-10046 SS5]
MSPTCAITFAASLGRRGDRLLAEFDGLFAPLLRAMSDMLHLPGKVSQWFPNAIVILCQYRLPRDPPRATSGAVGVYLPSTHRPVGRSITSSDFGMRLGHPGPL